MITVELMDNLAAYLRRIVQEYDTLQPSGKVPVEVYAGWPPVRVNAEEKASFIYALVISTEDKPDDDYGSATIEIGFSIYDEDTTDGWRSLYNIMEHVRQALLKKRTLAGRNRLELPLKGEITDEQPYPQWQGKITAIYTIGQPSEEGLYFDEYQETRPKY